MSPLWNDKALAKAAWANALERGLVNDDHHSRSLRSNGMRSALRRRAPVIAG